MPNPEHAHARRGAAFTFNGPAFLSLVQRIREPLSASSKAIYAPSFDHAKKDPVEGEIEIAPTSRIVVFEGNYLSLGKGEWEEAAGVMDELVCDTVPAIVCFQGPYLHTVSIHQNSCRKVLTGHDLVVCGSRF